MLLNRNSITLRYTVSGEFFNASYDIKLLFSDKYIKQKILDVLIIILMRETLISF